MNQGEKTIAYIDAELEEIIPMFFEQTWEDIQSVKDALEKGDYETLERLGHSIKGASLGYGFEEMGKIGKAIEEAAGDNKSLDEIRILVNNLIIHTDNVEVIYKVPDE
ncbi:MAG: Hpt domain-containing protein [Desulfobacterales bacterium]|nr:Hpt domain-containing protein [Desulfobacterales bacterium]